MKFKILILFLLIFNSISANTMIGAKFASNDNVWQILKQEIKRLGYNADLNHIDVSNVTDMRDVFSKSKFNGDISKWDVSNVTDMRLMFAIKSKFNGDISKWDVSNVMNMEGMFYESEFNGDISKWNINNRNMHGSSIKKDIESKGIAIKEALKDYKEKDYKSAFNKFLKLAKIGDSSAKNYVGLMYERGQGVEQNYTHAVYWYRKAANQDQYKQIKSDLEVKYKKNKQDLLSQAKKDKERIIFRARVKERDLLIKERREIEAINKDIRAKIKVDVEAEAERKKRIEAVKIGNINAKVVAKIARQTRLEDVESRLKEAVDDLNKQVKVEEHKQSQYTLGAMYIKGDGVDKDIQKGIVLITKVAKQGYEPAIEFLDKSKTTTLEEWWTKAAEQSDSHAQYQLGAPPPRR